MRKLIIMSLMAATTLLPVAASAQSQREVRESRQDLREEQRDLNRAYRYGDRGDTVGPDLTNISKRFQKKEILESIQNPLSEG